MFDEILRENVEKMIASGIFADRKIYLFGKNYPSFLTKDFLEDHQYQVSGIVDNSIEIGLPRKVDGAKVYNPNDLEDITDVANAFLICSKHFADMKKQLMDLGVAEASIYETMNLKEAETRVDQYVQRFKLLSLADIQRESLAMLKYVKKLCESNHLTYYLCGGTMLGAIRHKGFIPWDDDVDVSMPYPDYLKFLDIVKKDDKYDLVTQENGGAFRWNYAKICDRRTDSVFARFQDHLQTGLGIDIFPIFSIPDGAKGQKVMRMNIDLVRDIYRKYNHQIGRTGKDTEYLQTREQLRKLWEDIGYYDTQRVYRLSAYTDQYIGDFSNKNCYDDVIMMTFCDDEFPVPKGYDEIMRVFYGNYMELPPVEKRYTHSTSKIYWKE